jgi:hypothetical protein
MVRLGVICVVTTRYPSRATSSLLPRPDAPCIGWQLAPNLVTTSSKSAEAATQCGYFIDVIEQGDQGIDELTAVIQVGVGVLELGPVLHGLSRLFRIPAMLGEVSSPFGEATRSRWRGIKALESFE